ncbi:MAG: hypothetical protein Q8906_01830 [Bacillota bacterium]|nr:hypothetical protein [Bacillota bacterium]
MLEYKFGPFLSAEFVILSAKLALLSAEIDLLTAKGWGIGEISAFIGENHTPIGGKPNLIRESPLLRAKKPGFSLARVIEITIYLAINFKAVCS